jgi:uncharacterized integral membrane protein
MKKYSIISLFLIILSGLFTYINTNDTTTFNILGANITLYNALWIMLFLTTFYLISIIYFSIEKFKMFKIDRNLKKDKENILKNIENKILYKNQLLPIKELTSLEEIVEMIEGLKINPKESDLEFMNDILKLENGEVVDLKKYKLDKENPWVLKNIENKIKNGDKKAAIDALNSPLKDIAIEFLSKNADVKEILANDYPITKETILNNLDSDRLNELINKSNLTNKEYIEIAYEVYKKIENPEVVLELFKEKTVAYVYLLIEYEMIDKALELANEHDIKVFEYYLLLRKNGVKVDIKDYLDARI